MLEIPPDFRTLSLQVALFVVLWLVLSRFWFRPALRIMKERAARSEGAIAEAKAIQADAERLRAEHAAALDQVRGEAQREMQDIVRSAETAQKQMISEARDDAQRTLAEVRGRIAEEVATARRSLREQAESIAREVAHKVLGRPV
jgi:F-type H+-transporting ATPase subunit b